MKIGGLDEIAVDDGQLTDTRAGEETGGCRSGGSAADNGDMRGGEMSLALLADAGEEDLPGVPAGQVVVAVCGFYGERLWRCVGHG